MAARRSLGGGRVLGSGKPLTSPAPPPQLPPNRPQQLRSPALLSPSNSSASLSSLTSGTPFSVDNDEITARVALSEHGSTQAVAAARAKMVCPICNEEMLNRHIDDNHANLEEIEQEEAKNWFEQQMKKAKKFQPLQLLNQKLRGLETFESNNDTHYSPMPPTHPSTNEMRGSSPAPVHMAPSSPDPEDLITRSHWQRPYGGDMCSDPTCGKRLGAGNGQINCRHCGRLFCEDHTMYQMKLSRSAQHDPTRGLWYRVCETCYKTREGYNDTSGAERNHIEFFKTKRRKTLDKQYLETSRLETRLTRLTQLLADPPPPDPKQRTIWSAISGDKDHIRNLEQSIVPWEEDASVGQCHFCQQPFSQYSLRKHHCRICGRVVCGDPNTACSTEIGLDVDSQKSAGKVAVDVRMCKDCQRTIFSKADFAREIATETPDLRAYQNLVQFERGIRLLLPNFQRLLQALSDPDNPPPPQKLAEASKVRKRLTDAFTQYDVAARRIRDLPTDSATQARLQKVIYHHATNFLHVHMLPLKSIPKIMKKATANGNHRAPLPTKNSQGALAAIQYNKIANGGRPSPLGGSRTSSSSSAAVTALETEERELSERLIVLGEQKVMVSEMIVDANRRRKYDEVASLAQNVDDLSLEIDQIQKQLSQMDFASAYAEADGAVK